MRLLGVIGKIGIYTIVIILALITMFPIAFTVLGSLKSTQEVLTSASIFPKEPTFNNYKDVWQSIDFAKYTLNSIIISVSVVFGNLILASMTAYVLDRKQTLKGRKFISTLYISAIFVSIPVATIYPIFKLVVSLRLNNTLLGIILVTLSGDITSIFIIEGYLRGVTKEIDESATIDGCGFFRIYWNIIMPLIRPVLATVGLLSFRGSWNAYLMPLVLTMGNKKITPLTVAVVQLKSSGDVASNWAIMLAGATISLVPMIVAYAIANKQFIAGITGGAVKG
jgi:multiple sugar transport system permease protein